jgi:hypothetical protein
MASWTSWGVRSKMTESFTAGNAKAPSGHQPSTVLGT